MTDTSCPPDHEWMPFLSGEATDAVLGSHLATCSDCQRRLEGLRAEVDQLRSLPLLVHDASGEQRPAMIGRYLVVGQIDAGGQANVYRAVHPTLDRELVVKLSHKPLEGKTDVRPLLVAEGKLLASLEHPNLVRVYDLDFHEEQPFLVMEYVRGRDLGQYVKEHRLPPRAAAALVAKIARALEVIHRRGVVHQDIKPQNILIDEADQPRLIDFGLARLRHAWDDPGGSPSGGTPAFMSPEQARGELHRIGPASDLFALGSVLYFLLTGKVPFHGETVEKTVALARQGQFEDEALRQAPIPRRLAAICRKAMAAEPEQRHRSAAALAAELEQYLGTRRKFLIASASTLAAGLLGGGLWTLLRSQPQPPSPPASPPLTPALEVQVSREGRYMSLTEALPLRTDRDHLRIVAKVPPDQHAVLYSLNPFGRATRLEVDTSPADHFTRLVFPPQGGSAAFDEGPGGTEFLLLCIGSKENVARDLEPAIESVLRELPLLPPQTVIWLNREEPRFERPEGRPLRPVEGDATSTVLYRLDQLRQRLRDQYEVILGVAFSHRPRE